MISALGGYDRTALTIFGMEQSGPNGTTYTPFSRFLVVAALMIWAIQ